MNNNNGMHLPIARKIRMLEEKIESLETMRMEYVLLLNILILRGGGKFIMHSDEAKKALPVRTVRSEHRKASLGEISEGVPPGKLIEYTLVDPEPEKSLIVPAIS